MNGAQSETATGSDGESNTVDAAAGSTGNQAATTNHNWKSMEVQFRARAEAEGHDGIVQFGSEADLMEFLTAHLQTCSTAILEKRLASQGRTATDDWSWDDFKTVAMRCQDLAPKTNAGNQADTTSKLCDEIWDRWRQNEFPLLKPAECSDGSQMNLALAIIACLAEDVKPAIRDFTAKNTNSIIR